MGGSINITTTPASDTLCTVADVQAIPGIRADWTSAQITTAITAASLMIEEYTGRSFHAANYKIWLDGMGGKYLLLPEYPVITLRQVSIGEWQLASLVCTAASLSSYAVSVQDGKMNLTIVGGASAGTDTINLASYTSMAALGSAIGSLGKGWALTVLSESDPAALRPMWDNTRTSGSLLYLYGPDNNCAGVYVDGDMLYIGGEWPNGPSTIYVDYRAGYTTIPGDLSMTTAKLAIDLLHAAGSDGRITEEKVVNYSKKLSGAGILAPYQPELAPYQNITT